MAAGFGDNPGARGLDAGEFVLGTLAEVSSLSFAFVFLFCWELELAFVFQGFPGFSRSVSRMADGCQVGTLKLAT